MKIPQYSRQADINPANLPQADPQSMTADLGAARKFGAEMTEFGATELHNIVQTQKKIKEREDKVTALTIFQNSTLAKEQAHNEFINTLDGTDNFGKIQKYQESLAGFDEKALSNVSPEAAEIYRTLAIQHNTGLLKTASDHAAKALRAREANTAQGQIDLITRGATKNGGMTIDQDLAKVDSTVDYLELPADVRDKVKRAGRFQIVDTVIRSNIADPVFGPAFIQSLKDEKTRQAWFDKADPDKVDEYKRLIGAADNKITEDTAYAHVFQRFGLKDEAGDYEGAIKELRNPMSEIPAIKTLSATQRNTIENMVQGQQAYNIQEKNRKFAEGKKNALDVIGETIIKGDIKSAIRMTETSPFIPGMDKAKIVEDLKKPAPEGKSNPGVYLAGSEKMYDPNLPLTEKKQWLLSNRGSLTDTDFKHLTGIGMSQERSNDKAAVKAGIDTLKAALITPGFVSKTQTERLDRAIKLYESGVQQYGDTLKNPDAIKSYANQILKMSEFSRIDPVADMRADMQKIRGVGLTNSPAVNTAPAKTVMIDGKAYKDGDIHTDKEGKRSVVRIK